MAYDAQRLDEILEQIKVLALEGEEMIQASMPNPSYDIRRIQGSLSVASSAAEQSQERLRNARKAGLQI